MFVTVRGIDRLGEDFVLPTCPKFYNIFHPYDPVAYRFETLIDVKMVNVPPVLIPHHKGRKRMHIGKCVMAVLLCYRLMKAWFNSTVAELRETMARFSADIKERFFGSVRSTWSTVQNLTSFRSSLPSSDETELERSVKKKRNLNIKYFSLDFYFGISRNLRSILQSNHSCVCFSLCSAQQEELENCSRDESAVAEKSVPIEQPVIRIGKLNGGCRIDYVLQEAPLESFNEYLFALTSHVGYWYRVWLLSFPSSITNS